MYRLKFLKRRINRINRELHKVHIFWEGQKNLQNLHRRFGRYYIGQIYGGDFAKKRPSHNRNELCIWTSFKYSTIRKYIYIYHDFLQLSHLSWKMKLFMRLYSSISERWNIFLQFYYSINHAIVNSKVQEEGLLSSPTVLPLRHRKSTQGRVDLFGNQWDRTLIRLTARTFI